MVEISQSTKKIRLDPTAYRSGDWIEGRFPIKNKFNCYVGQIINIVEDEPTKRVFQFYRTVTASQNTFTKLLSEEIQDVDIIVETISKDSIEIIDGF